MLAAIGSTNPVKLAAAKAVIGRLYGVHIDVVAVSVPTGVPSQPWGDKQTRRGAINRARAAQAATSATWGLGLEGGLLEIEDDGDAEGLYTNAWCAVVDEYGTLGAAGGANMWLPPSVVASLRAGLELGAAIDRLTGLADTSNHDGAIGALTQGWLTRRQAFEQILTLAFSRWLSPHFYI
ncbi:MAG: inosine/xanthosine triphosphatase [Anaerolineae bacterium]|nr:inosine/xanthosine triphosphatase [Anaerolineae bacterium]